MCALPALRGALALLTLLSIGTPAIASIPDAGIPDDADGTAQGLASYGGAGGAGTEAAPESWTPDPSIESDAADLLADDRFRFCQESGYRLWPHEKDTYCPLAKHLEKRCPELPRACERPAFGVSAERDWNFDFSPNLEWLGAAADLARLLFWLVLGLGVALLLRALIKNVADELQRRRSRQNTAPELVEWTPDAPETPRETDVQRLLARARDEAARGDFAAACSTAYAAALRALEHRRLLELHRSRTNGDYLRQLGAHPAEREQLRGVVREIETVQFGHAPPDQARYERILARVAALVGQAATLLLLVAAPFLFTGCSDGPTPDAPGSAHGPDGYALLEGLLQRHSGSVGRRVRRVTGGLDNVTTFVALSPHLREEEWERLMDWVSSGGTLLAAGVSSQLARHLEHDPKVRPCESALEAPGLELVQARAATFETFPETSTIVSCGEAPFLVGMDFGEGVVYVLADEDWLRNANLAAADNAQLVVQLLASPEGRVELLGPWTGSGANHPLESVHNAGLTPWLLQLLVLALAYGVSRGVRFRTPVEPVREQRRAFAEHAEALANQYARSKSSGYALEQYGRWAIERIRERVPVRERDLHALAHAVARRTGGEPMAILKILVEVQSAGQIQGAPEEHHRTMQALSRILRDVGGASSEGKSR
jgi:hypothetical protein